MPVTGGLDEDEVRTAPGGRVLLAPVGSSTPPDDAADDLDDDWNDVGYIDEEGVSMSPDVSLTAIKKWQSLMPVKYSIDEVLMEVSFVMNQFNRENTSTYFYGAQWTFLPNGNSKLVVPAAPSIRDLERALVIEFTDDQDEVTRFYFARGIVIERQEMTLNKGDVKLGLTYHVMASNNEMMEIFTNNSTIYSA